MDTPTGTRPRHLGSRGRVVALVPSRWPKPRPRLGPRWGQLGRHVGCATEECGDHQESSFGGHGPSWWPKSRWAHGLDHHGATLTVAVGSPCPSPCRCHQGLWGPPKHLHLVVTSTISGAWLGPPWGHLDHGHGVILTMAITLKMSPRATRTTKSLCLVAMAPLGGQSPGGTMAWTSMGSPRPRPWCHLDHGRGVTLTTPTVSP